MSVSIPSCASSGASRVVLITGAAHRIGRALALGFATQGWDVAVHFGVSRVAAEAVVSEIIALGRRATALQADLAIEEEVAQLVPSCIAALGRPVCLINNASRFVEDRACEVGYPTLLSLMAINVGAPLVLARALYDATPEAASDDETLRGVIINVLDQKLYNLNPDYLSYTLSKAALQTATITLAQAFAPKVRVVGLAPGLTLPSGEQTLEGFRAAHQATPLHHASRPEDIVAAACYLATAGSVTGATLIVDGGQHLAPLPRDVMFLT